jgi:hypothetical protein
LGRVAEIVSLPKFGWEQVELTFEERFQTPFYYKIEALCLHILKYSSHEI